MSTPLFERAMAYNYGDDERNALMRMVWSPTPWMIDVITGSIESSTYREMTQWCRDNLGKEALPIHEQPGVWQRGSATVHGTTWYGFKTEALMNRFLDRFPQEGQPS